MERGERRGGWIGGGSGRGGVEGGPGSPGSTADRLLMVFVSPRPVPVQGADSLGCYIKELWACRGPT